MGKERSGRPETAEKLQIGSQACQRTHHISNCPNVLEVLGWDFLAGELFELYEQIDGINAVDLEFFVEVGVHGDDGFLDFELVNEDRSNPRIQFICVHAGIL